jgi:uncharacterized protein (TIGR03032 family)
MKKTSAFEKEELWRRHDSEWRNPAQVTVQWSGAGDIDPSLIKPEIKGSWWQTLADCQATIFVTREYEHLAMAMTVHDDRPLISFLPMPHPSGLAVNQARKIVYLASTRNPNQIYDLAPVKTLMETAGVKERNLEHRPLVPVRSRFFPGSLYIHDLALIKDELYGNAVGQNAVVKLSEGGDFLPAWWPRCVDSSAGPIFDRNLIQLNSIAAGTDLASSFFSASADRISSRRPGQPNFPVDGRGVIFSGKTREAIVHGLTRPHSARLWKRELWVDNSGYGEFGKIEDGKFETLAKLPGWTRGLCFKNRIAFVGTSRIIPRFRQYAPGLDVDKSVCGIHAVDLRSGRVRGSITWPLGNQIFAIEWMPKRVTTGFPFLFGKQHSARREKLLFYAYQNRSTRGARNV